MPKNPVHKLLTEKIEFPDNRLLVQLRGALDHNLRHLEQQLQVTLLPQGNGVLITADRTRAKKVRQLLETLYADLEQGHPVDHHWVERGIRALDDTESWHAPALHKTAHALPPSGEVALRTPRRQIYPRTNKQSEYLRALQQADLTFAIGPAGTGKTYLAVAAAVTQWLDGRVARIVLTRPAVEAGERLGFLPGDLQAKVDPYLRPLHDALYAMLGPEKVERMLSRNELEVAPLAYMRGRTLDESFIILDEAQNTTTEQMKMFLTRFGEGSRAVISGDITQIDLPKGQPSGLVQAAKILQNIPEAVFVYFTHQDVVRHPLVGKIVQAYEQAQAGQRKKELARLAED
ncbi:PhoH family protein [Candidatus Magnetaquicoccus inordinatus]|uniref:PhoH family protein n=1 Tax=Candidatus Magnetaquicoccus inordinatus TaxID=2496818 RepID=UPI00102C14E7|nr:PhoH family protein [Candidatus Magnetaquicoccus inordinatus]